MAVDELRLRNDRPRRKLRVPVHGVRRPRFPVVDAHNHLASSPADLPEQGRWQIHGIGLPDDVRRTVYADNARGLLRLEPA
jgi:hypothetical protein